MNRGPQYLILLLTLSLGSKVFAEESDYTVVVPKLREYCTSCHGVGDLRFIRSESDKDVWTTILTEKAPKSQKLWAEAIIEVLSWPNGKMPNFDSTISPGKDWMPKGSKRIRFASDLTYDRPTREVLVEKLRRNLDLPVTQALADMCKPTSAPDDPTLTVREGYMDFLPKLEVQALVNKIPTIKKSSLNEKIRDSNTMWYNEDSMVFAYQDSIEPIVGLRANCVGRSVGERNRNDPDISKLLNYFGNDYRFREPFRKAAGTSDVTNVKVYNFWVPPKNSSGKVIPVKYWRPTSRERWRWSFPVGTLIGEVLLEQAPDKSWHVFEVRTRERYIAGWGVDLFRPYRKSTDLASKIKTLRPEWSNNGNLNQVVNHLENSSTLLSYSMASVPFAKIFPKIDGFLDVIPEIEDPALVAELLAQPFESMEGAVWKESNGKETYAPSSAGQFSVVPRGYDMGIIPVNDVSCQRCHVETGRRLEHLEFKVMLYGEVWGEDQIFTWHPFKPNPRMFDTWDDASGSRLVNPKMIQAGLLKYEKPASGDPTWKPLPSAYDAPSP